MSKNVIRFSHDTPDNTYSSHVRSRTHSSHIRSRTHLPHVRSRTYSPHVRSHTHSPHICLRSFSRTATTMASESNNKTLYKSFFKNSEESSDRGLYHPSESLSISFLTEEPNN
ncbi:5100_t:CDS:2, partial [Racocetra persica]